MSLLEVEKPIGKETYKRPNLIIDPNEDDFDIFDADEKTSSQESLSAISEEKLKKNFQDKISERNEKYKELSERYEKVSPYDLKTKIGTIKNQPLLAMRYLSPKNIEEMKEDLVYFENYYKTINKTSEFANIFAETLVSDYITRNIQKFRLYKDDEKIGTRYLVDSGLYCNKIADPFVSQDFFDSLLCSKMFINAIVAQGYNEMTIDSKNFFNIDTMRKSGSPTTNENEFTFSIMRMMNYSKFNDDFLLYLEPEVFSFNLKREEFDKWLSGLEKIRKRLDLDDKEFTLFTVNAVLTTSPKENIFSPKTNPTSVLADATNLEHIDKELFDEVFARNINKNRFIQVYPEIDSNLKNEEAYLLTIEALIKAGLYKSVIAINNKYTKETKAFVYDNKENHKYVSETLRIENLFDENIFNKLTEDKILDICNKKISEYNKNYENDSVSFEKDFLYVNGVLNTTASRPEENADISIRIFREAGISQNKDNSKMILIPDIGVANSIGHTITLAKSFPFIAKEIIKQNIANCALESYAFNINNYTNFLLTKGCPFTIAKFAQKCVDEKGNLKENFGLL